MNALEIIKTIIAILGILSTTYLWLHSHNLKFYLWIQRARHKLLPSKSVTWDVQGRWEGIGDESVLDDISDWIMEFYNKNVSIIEKNSRGRNYLIENRFNLETSYEQLDIKSEGYHFSTFENLCPNCKFC